MQYLPLPQVSLFTTLSDKNIIYMDNKVFPALKLLYSEMDLAERRKQLSSTPIQFVSKLLIKNKS